MQTMLVTGGAGFIGSNFVRLALAETTARVVVVDKLTYAGHMQNLAAVVDDPRLVFIEGDIGDRRLIERLYRDERPSRVLNFAAESHVDRSIDSPRIFVETNVVGTFELLEGARLFLRTEDESFARRFRFLHVSTDEVFGSLGPGGLFDEESPYAPSSPYAASKAAADHFVRAFNRTFELPTLITNCSNNYGPFQLPEKLIPLTLLKAIRGEDLPIYGDGSNVRDWIHVEDHCRGLLQALEHGRVGDSYGFGASCESSNVDIVDTLCGLLEERLPAAANSALAARGASAYTDLKRFVIDRPGHDQRYAIDAGKARRELDWRPRYDLRSGLAATVDWYLANEEWCRAVRDDGVQGQRLGILAPQA
jgi:dTDP-glucose 4,6-dehydratase